MRILRTTVLPAVLLALIAASPAIAGPEEDQARKVFENNKDAVVTLELVLKQSYSMMGSPTQEQETEMTALGTIIGPDGLTVAALSTMDPSGIYENLMGSMGGDSPVFDVSEAKIILEDRTEIPARVVLRDRDLDLAFIRPLEKPEEELPYVDFTQSGTPQILDRVVTISRLGKVANRVHAVSFEWIEAMVEKPRPFYIPGNNITSTGQGSPAFLLDGKIAGVFVMRTIKTSGDGGMWGMQDNMMGIIRPASDVVEVMEQVPSWDEEEDEAAEEEAVDEAADTME